MKRFTFVIVLGLTPLSLFAGIYDPISLLPQAKQSPFLPNEKSPFQIRDGKAVPLEFGSRFDGDFANRMAALSNMLDANPKRQSNPDRDAEFARIKELQAMPDSKTSPLVAAALAAAYVRVGKSDQAVAILFPYSRGRSATFAVLMNLAHAHATMQDWESALRTHEVALEYDAKDELKSLSPDQLKWLLNIEKKYYRAWLSWNLKNPKPNPATDEPPPIFGPIKWVNAAGEYEPGKLAESEKAKLPADAIAIVQQMRLWNPTDTNLYWLLAELYAADGQLRQAATIFDQCANSLQFSNRKLLMAHREAVNNAVAKLPPESTDDLLIKGLDSPKPAEEGDNGLPPMNQVIIVSAIALPIVLLLLYLQARKLIRAMKR
ncbi:MAG: tetratricopeptide repeat protein [Gemmataceae bacterium]